MLGNKRGNKRGNKLKKKHVVTKIKKMEASSPALSNTAIADSKGEKVSIIDIANQLLETTHNSIMIVENRYYMLLHDWIRRQASEAVGGCSESARELKVFQILISKQQHHETT